MPRANQDFDEAIRLNPHNAGWYLERGHVHSLLDQYEQAIQDYDAAIRLNPRDASAYGWRGSAYASLGQSERAIEDYDEAIRLDPKFGMVYEKRGAEYACLGQYARAEQDVRAAIRVLPPRGPGEPDMAVILYDKLEWYSKRWRDAELHAELVKEGVASPTPMPCSPTPPSTAAPSFCPGAISWVEASQHVGSEKRVKGPVASTNYASSSNNQPTFLNLGQPYPDHKFTVVIWGRNRANFPGTPEQIYLDRTICVTGLIETYQGKPQIEATAARQIVVAP